MKSLFFLCLLFPSLLAQNANSCLIKQDLFEGYIFDKDYQLMFVFPGQKDRIELQDDDIIKAEQILRAKIKIINRFKPNQSDRVPVIDQNLGKYTRQYVGYTNKKGEKIVWINCIWTNIDQNELPVNVVRKFNGCSYFWNVKVNLTTKELFDLDVNFCG